MPKLRVTRPTKECSMMKRFLLCVLPLAACAPVDTESEGVAVQLSTATLAPIQDTWISVTSSGTFDWGKSCQLRVSPTTSTTRNHLLVQFQPLTAAQCATLSSAVLRLRTAPPLPSPGFGATAFRIVNAWTAGTTGSAACAACEVTSGTPSTITLPSFTDPASTVGPTAACNYFPWNVTSIVQHWCANPGTDHGILLTGPTTGTASFLNFHSMEAPVGSRPELVITF
jgi:hypothetical protein